METIELVKKYIKEYDYPEDNIDFADEKSAEEKRCLMNKINHLRLNVLAGLDIKTNDKVLILDEEDSIITAFVRNKTSDVTVRMGLDDLEGEYDWIISIGTLPEIAQGDFAGCFRKVEEVLSEYGKFVLAINNALGLKYFNGHREENSKGYFISVEGFKDYSTKTIKRRELEKNLRIAGFEGIEVSYPYPDYKYATSVFTEDRLPGSGELRDYFEGSEMQHICLYDETAAWNQLNAEGLFEEFANAFYVVAEKKKISKSKKVVYTRFSNDRDNSKSIRTVMTSEGGDIHIYKMSDSPMSSKHIENIRKAFDILEDNYSGANIHFNKYSEPTCEALKLIGAGKGFDAVELEFVDGQNFEDILDEKIKDGDIEALENEIYRMAERIRKVQYSAEFEASADFENVFGKCGKELKALNLTATNAADIDMIPGNIIVLEDGQWLVLDYEWTFNFSVPVNFILYRSIHYYVESNIIRKQNAPADIYEKVGISNSEIRIYEEMERNFQKYVVGNHVPLSLTSKQMMDKPNLHIANIVKHTEAHVMRQYHSLQFDFGAGFVTDGSIYHENENILPDLIVDENFRSIWNGGNVQGIKLNLWNYDSALIEIRDLAFRLEDGSMMSALPQMITSAYPVSENVYYFDHGNPCLYITEVPGEAKDIVAYIHIVETNETIKQALVPKILWKRGLKKKLLGK